MSPQKPILIFILLSSLLLACMHNTSVSTYLEIHSLKNKFHSIIVLTEEGCPNCNSNLADVIAHSKFDSTLLVVNALGTVIDLTELRQNEMSNTIVYDYQENYKEFGLKGSGVILLNENLEVDSVIKIDARDLVQQLEFVKNLSNENKHKKNIVE